MKKTPTTAAPHKGAGARSQADSKKLSKFFNIESRSPGGGGSLGNDNENSILDYFSPHTTRQRRHWEIDADEIRGLMAKFKKPVVYDEPARNGTPKFGGPSDVTSPFDRILHIKEANLFLQVAFLTQTTMNTIKLFLNL